MDLVNLDEFKTYKTINVSSEDTKIGLLILSASNFVKSYCGRTFIDYYSSNKTEYYDGTVLNEILLKEFPLVDPANNVTLSKSIDGGETYEELTLYTDYFIDYERDSIITGSKYTFLPEGYVGPNSLKVVYKGGYEQAPADVKIATMDLIEYYRQEEYIPKRMMSGATQDNAQFRLDYSSNLPPHIKRVLDMYRVVI